MVFKACYQILIVSKPVGSEYKFQFKFGRKRQRMESNEQGFGVGQSQKNALSVEVTIE